MIASRQKARERQLEMLEEENERLKELLADAKEAIGDLMNANHGNATDGDDHHMWLEAMNKAAEVYEAI